jgi:alcohol dehydrogenase
MLPPFGFGVGNQRERRQAVQPIGSAYEFPGREDLKSIGGNRTIAVGLTGNVAKDTEQFRSATVGGIHVALDMVGRAIDPDASLAALRSLRRGGRLVLMGSMNVPLCISYGEVMVNNWEIIGNFMYPNSAYRRLLDLVRTGNASFRCCNGDGIFASRLARRD